MVLICLPPVSKTAESQSKPVPCPQLQQLTFQFRTSRSVKCHVVKFESPIDSHHRLEFDAPVEDHRSSPKAKSGCDSTIVHYQLAMLCCHKSPSQNNKTSPNFYGDSIAKNPFQTIFFLLQNHRKTDVFSVMPRPPWACDDFDAGQVRQKVHFPLERVHILPNVMPEVT